MSMQVKHLVEELQKLDPELYIVVSSDNEGSTYSFLEGMAINSRLRDGEIHLAELTPDLVEQGYTEEDVSEEGIDCIVLYPSHDTDMLEALIENTAQKK